MKNKHLKKRIVEISRKHNLGHLGSCLTAVDIINDIFEEKRKDEKFVLSAGHSGLALYVVLEDRGYADAEQLLEMCGIHPDRVSECIDCSTGSLGHGLPIAVGMAVSDPKRDVYVLISDGEMAEGSMYEALNYIQNKNLTNIKIYINYNGYTAYDSTPTTTRKLIDMMGVDSDRIRVYGTDTEEFPHIDGLLAHYKVLNDSEFKDVMEAIDNG